MAVCANIEAEALTAQNEDHDLNYEFELDLDNPASTHAIQFRMVPDGSTVLDVGCHTGILGEALIKRRHCRVIGIDHDSEALAKARTRLEEALQVDLESATWVKDLSLNMVGGFNVILFGDVLEHTRNPAEILKQSKALLKPGGRVIVSVPNVVNLRVRLKILMGKFEYEDSGILDRTHLRFFTKESAQSLVKDAGFRIVDSDVSGYSLPHRLIRIFPGLLAVQFITAAVPI